MRKKNNELSLKLNSLFSNIHQKEFGIYQFKFLNSKLS